MSGTRLARGGTVLVVALGILGVASSALAVGDEDLPEVEVTAQMVAGSTLDLRTDASTIDLRTGDSTIDLRTGDSTLRLEVVREEAERTVVVLTSDLLFEFASDDLSPVAAGAVVDLVRTVPQGAAVSVDGHTDSLGDDAVNDPLSQQRADAVAAVLRAERPDLVLAVAGHGSRKPVAENTLEGEDSPSGRALNRRVELSFEAS